MARRDAPDIVVGRLPIYLRALEKMRQAGHEITSSAELGGLLGISSAQIRKDLSHFGEFGKQGTGYEITYLRDQISKILNVDRSWPVALVGFGDLGQAIAHYGGFATKGFHIELVFDADSTKIGQKTNNTTVQNVENLVEIISQSQIKIAIIAVPAPVAQTVADKLIEAGIRAILNYAPITLKVPDFVRVQYIDPVVHLQTMTYFLA
jgi:redox-sensing transcriptional repressor